MLQVALETRAESTADWDVRVMAAKASAERMLRAILNVVGGGCGLESWFVFAVGVEE